MPDSQRTLLKAMTVSAGEADPRTSHALHIRALAAFAVYLSGRLDAADRRAGMVLTASGAMLAVFASEFTSSLTDETLIDRLTLVIRQPSVVLAMFAAIMGLCSIWPRIRRSDGWVSRIFLKSEPPTEIYIHMLGSDSRVVTDFIMDQQNISELVRIKNKYVLRSIPVLLFSAIAFGLGY
jgi:hypothetical protein